MATTTQDKKELNVNDALKRMDAHARNSHAAFAETLKVKAPKTHGRLAGQNKA